MSSARSPASRRAAPTRSCPVPSWRRRAWTSSTYRRWRSAPGRCGRVSSWSGSTTSASSGPSSDRPLRPLASLRSGRGPRMTRIGLSTVSVYPESTAHAFAYAASVGYDAVEVMVGVDGLSQQVEAVHQLSVHHDIPISAIHAPCLLFTQRVWGTEPWGKLYRSADMAHAVGAGTVVVHPPFRWQKEYAAGFVTGIERLEKETGLNFWVENMYPWKASSRRGVEMYLPGRDPSDEPYANTTIDLSHAAIAGDDVVAMAQRLGSRLRHIHLTDGT